MRTLRVIIGAWLLLGVVIVSVRNLPEIAAAGLGTALFARLSVTALFVAVAVWLIREPLLAVTVGKLNESFTQCEVRRLEVRHVLWMPTRLVAIGKSLKIQENGKWHDGFEITKAFQTAIRSEIRDLLTKQSSLAYQFDR